VCPNMSSVIMSSRSWYFDGCLSIDIYMKFLGW
jgi:hypothetical protein